MTGGAPYDPRPIESSDASLAPSLRPLIEPLAANAHETWARTRSDEGWTRGARKDASALETPFLVPFRDLSEAEKEVDRTLVRSTLNAAQALGCVMEAPPERCSADEEIAVSAWEQWLKKTLSDSLRDDRDERARPFDLDDAEALASSEIAAFPVLRSALSAFHEELEPAWKEADALAGSLQRRHRRVAQCAIWPGIAAILLGAIRSQFDAHGGASAFVTAAEFIAASIAAAAVAFGFIGKTRDRWLTARQSAERMRVVKFRALADEALFADEGAWRARWSHEIGRLARLDAGAAKAWVSGGSAEPRVPEPSTVRIPPAELAALSAYYRCKRQEYQRHYFATRAEQHRDDLWMLRLKLPVWLFAASVAFVLLHAIPELAARIATPSGGEATSDTTELASLALVMSAVLPVIGFGLRAWFSAFELPRRAHLFESKARQLGEAIERTHADRHHARKTLTHIELGEHFFENEHREWCRLILEAEWFV